MVTSKEVKDKCSFLKTNMPLLPYASVKINCIPDDKKKQIEQIIKRNAERNS